MQCTAFFIIIAQKLNTVLLIKYLLGMFHIEQGISTDMANYLTMVFDPAAPNLVSYLRIRQPEVVQILQELDLELEGIMVNKSMNFIALLESIAVT